ncbi:uncharacterized protein [Macrobrachium rosenbergii]|uniref:uncharacterized protein n=1 Tax=Macrobrachium rosenbergii TaxID=79674 RepID=UPI0034D4228E
MSQRELMRSKEKDPTCPAASILSVPAVQHTHYRIHSKCQCHHRGVCDPKKTQRVLPSTTINTTAEYNTSAAETKSTVKCQYHRGVSPRKIPRALHASATINSYQIHANVTTPQKDPTCCANQLLSVVYNATSCKSQLPIQPKKDPTCSATSTTINTTAEYNTSATESTVAVNTTSVCNPNKDPTCPATSTTISTTAVQHLSYRIHSESVNTTEGCATPGSRVLLHQLLSIATAEYNSSATESTVAVNVTEGVIQKDPCSSSTTVIATVRQHLSYRQEVCDPKKDPRVLLHQLLSVPQQTTTPQLRITRFNTSATESTVSVNTTEEVCNPKKDPTCPAPSTTINATAEGCVRSQEKTPSSATSTTINTTSEYNTSATESTVAANTNATEAVCDPKKDPTCPKSPHVLLHQLSIPQQSTAPQLQNPQ